MGQIEGATRQPPKTWEDALDTLTAEFRAIMIERHRKYGPRNFSRFGDYGVVIRLNDKLERLAGIYERGTADFSDEATSDTWADVSNYGMIGEMIRRGWWELPAECLGQGWGAGFV